MDELNELNFTLSFDDLKVMQDVVDKKVKINIAPIDAKHIAVRLYTTINGERVEFHKLLPLDNYFIKDNTYRKGALKLFAELTMDKIRYRRGKQLCE